MFLTVRLGQRLLPAGRVGPKPIGKLGQRIVATGTDLLRRSEPHRIGRFGAADLEELAVGRLSYDTVLTAPYTDGACGLSEPADQVKLGVLERPRVLLHRLLPVPDDLVGNGLMLGNGVHAIDLECRGVQIKGLGTSVLMRCRTQGA